MNKFEKAIAIDLRTRWSQVDLNSLKREEVSVSKLKIVWRIVAGCLYLLIVIAVLSMAQSRFETLVLAGLVELYAAILYNFSLISSATDINNYAGFIRFRILATAQGLTGNEDGAFIDQEKALRESLDGSAKFIIINRVSNGLVSLYAIYKIIAALLT